MSGLGEQIAVLDGLSALDPSDGRIGQARASATQYARQIMPGVLARRNVLDASGGANYGGGSSYAAGLPLLPSNVGLAGLGRAYRLSPSMEAARRRWVQQQRAKRGLGSLPGVLPPMMNVIDPSGGANYTGGSDWTPGMPLTVSSAGLAAALIQGGYGRAGLGASFIQGGYGRAGLGQTNSAADEDLAGLAEMAELSRALGDGRISQTRAQVDEYGRAIMPGVLARSNVIDASDGGNYSGGSAYAPGLPLLPSSVGLAGLDGLSDLALFGSLGRVFSSSRSWTAGTGAAQHPVRTAWYRNLVKMAGQAPLNNSKKKYISAYKAVRLARTPQQQQTAQDNRSIWANRVAAIRAARASLFLRHGAVGSNFAMQAPLWSR